ncbi:mRNA cap guanine-N7 methyltransferase 2 [Impatiens glandulifera]|uniref:mRNA cap guanine-N7 methyltransferase 2 n=1 Tax=Impatiens glandulifera TaxID=253017 RepID=UPI001FB192CE|nr:mRNA cap guanine-N7 methyltransferase 2 [Impatiens glandulifera]
MGSSYRSTTEGIHHRIFEFSRTALIRIFASPYATVCDLFCGTVPDEAKWDAAQIGHYIGIDVTSSGISQVREAWESRRKTYTSEFLELDPCIEDIGPLLQGRSNVADIVCCMQHLQLCFQTEEKGRKLMQNVASLLKPGGYFIGICPDSSTIWAKYQKNIEAYHNRSGSMKPNIVPIRSENYTITFEVEEEKFPFFGKKYQIRFANESAAETHYLVHFASLLRLGREVGLDYIEIQNLNDFYDDNRAKFAGMLLDTCPSLFDSRGKLIPKTYDVLGLYTTFIFQKSDPDVAPPLMTPVQQDEIHTIDETLQREMQGALWIEEKNTQTQASSSSASIGLGKISEQKGILGPGPAQLRFSEPM